MSKIVLKTNEVLKPRILIVEDDPVYVEIHKKNLTEWGYIPIIAEGQANALLESAMKKAKTYRCHLALVDLYLFDGKDKEDPGGLRLIPYLKPTEAIIVSGSTNFQTVRKIMEKFPTIRYVGKGEKPEKLKDVLNEVLIKLCESLKKIEIVYPSKNFKQIINARIFQAEKGSKGMPSNEIREVLYRLFPGASLLKVEAFDGTSNTPSLAPRPRSIILRVTQDEDVPVIVKIARVSKIEKEKRNYTAIVNRLVGLYVPRFEGVALLWDLGGAKYTVAGTSRALFSAFYKGHSASDIVRVLERLFNVWQDCYKGSEPLKKSLFKSYTDVWGDEWKLRLKGITLRHWGDDRFFAFDDYGLPDPFIWLKSKVDLNSDTSRLDNLKSKTAETDASLFPGSRVAMTHGDLHGDNFFVDGDLTPWSIDFERSGWGPILQDFVELEFDIVSRLLEAKNFINFFYLCAYLLKSEEIEINYSMQSEDQDLQKAADVVLELRKIAKKKTLIQDGRQYLWGLLLNALFRATLLKTKEEDFSRMLVEILASMICHRLDHWGDKWPPDSWKLNELIRGHGIEMGDGKSQETRTKKSVTLRIEEKPIIDRNQQQQKIDFVLITALPEECNALLEKLPGYQQLNPKDIDIRTYYQAQVPFNFPQGSKGTYNIMVMNLLGMGRVQATTASADAIHRWHPRYILMVGIAGGIASAGVEIGDILISDQIVDYELQKLTPEGPQIRWDVQRADARLLNASITFRSDAWQNIIKIRRPRQGLISLHTGPIASGDKVIAFGEVMAKYQETWPKLIGVEMEAAGVATAAFQSPEKPGFFMVRGVSDLADENKNKRSIKQWRSYACEVAASFTIAFLQSGPVPLQDYDQ